MSNTLHSTHWINSPVSSHIGEPYTHMVVMDDDISKYHPPRAAAQAKEMMGCKKPRNYLYICMQSSTYWSMKHVRMLLKTKTWYTTALKIFLWKVVYMGFIAKYMHKEKRFRKWIHVRGQFKKYILGSLKILHGPLGFCRKMNCNQFNKNRIL